MQRSISQPGDQFMNIDDTYADTLFRIVMVHLGRREDADEATQDTFIKWMEKAPAFNDAEHPKAWLIRAMTNHCKSLLRKSWRNRGVKLEAVEPITMDNPEDQADKQMKKRIGQNVNAVRQKQTSKRPLKSLYITASIGLAAPTVWQQWGGTSAPVSHHVLYRDRRASVCPIV